MFILDTFKSDFWLCFIYILKQVVKQPQMSLSSLVKFLKRVHLQILAVPVIVLQNQSHGVHVDRRQHCSQTRQRDLEILLRKKNVKA